MLIIVPFNIRSKDYLSTSSTTVGRKWKGYGGKQTLRHFWSHAKEFLRLNLNKSVNYYCLARNCSIEIKA